jgi:transcriptional regulator with XRE-family HTH domain
LLRKETTISLALPVLQKVGNLLTMDATKIVGQNIRKYRQEKGLKLETLAKAIRIDKTTMSKIETGQSEITISRIEKIAAALQIDYNLLVSTTIHNINITNSPNSGGINGNNHINDVNLVGRMLELSERVMELSKK